MKLATWQPSWTKNSKQGDVLQWTTIDDVHAWPFSGDVLKVWEVLICAAYTNEGHCSLLTSTVAQFQARDHLGYEHKWKWLLGLKYWDLTAKRCILRNPKLAVWRPYWIWPKFYLTCIKISYDRSWLSSIWMWSIHSSCMRMSCGMVSICKVYGKWNWLPGGHLASKVQNEATCINGPL